MVKTQRAKCKLERAGVRHVLKSLNLKKRNCYTHPFDVESAEFAIEVKTLSADCKDLKIHIADNSLRRKLEYAVNKGKQPLLMAVLIFKTGEVELYKSELRQSVRIRQMAKI